MRTAPRKKPVKKVSYGKQPTTFADQVDLLESRGLFIPDKPRAEFFLSQLNYYRFSAYCLPFEQDHASHQFKAHVGFDDVLNLYVFDRELRLLMLDAIERIEVSLRTQLAYHLSHSHQTAHPHLKPELFFNPLVYGSSINKLANDVRQSREEFVKHLTRKYDELLPPIWAVVELMTMGQLSKWFSNIRARSDRQAISKDYGLDEKVMVSFCEHLSLVRNHCAHHSRLWNRDFTKTMMLPKRGDTDLIASLFFLPDSDRRLRKLYNSFAMLAYLMNIVCGESHWKERLITLIEQRNIDISKMGFPADWKIRPIWQPLCQ